MPGSEFEFRADDGQTLLGRRWLPEGPRARFCRSPMASPSTAPATPVSPPPSTPRATRSYANDHRGHGPKAAPADLGHFADEGGWDKVVGDLWTFNRLIAAEQPGLPIVFLGHSLGSFLGRGFLAKHSDALAGAALSGSNGKPPAIATLGRLIAREERLRLGKRGKSALILQLWFGEFNKPFKPARTDFDWLSRDERQVDAFVADPLCGFPFTTQLAIDVLDALPYVTSQKSLATIRKDMAVYVFSGERDPVGANIKGLIQDLKAAGFTQLTTRLYPGARHETLNETNRDEVTRDLIAWLDGIASRVSLPLAGED